MSNPVKPAPHRTIAAIRRRLAEVESMAWVLRLLLHGAELDGIDPATVQAEVERIGGELDTLAGSLAGKFVRRRQANCGPGKGPAHFPGVRARRT